jgi:hypothetical protein
MGDTDEQPFVAHRRQVATMDANGLELGSRDYAALPSELERAIS